MTEEHWPKWEYKATALNGDSTVDDLQKLDPAGRDGWELVAVTSDTTKSVSIAYLKRKARPPQAPQAPANAPAGLLTVPQYKVLRALNLYYADMVGQLLRLDAPWMAACPLCGHGRFEHVAGCELGT